MKTRCLVFVGAVAATTPVHAADEPRSASVEASIRSEVGYDSNPIYYSDADIQSLESGTTSQKFRVERADQLFVVPIWPRVAVQDLFTVGDVSARFGFGAKVQVHVPSRVLNRGQYDLSFGLGELDTSYSYRPRRYRREYRSPATDQYDSAIYTEQWIRLGARLRPTQLLELRPRIRIRLRGYEAPFGFRDSFAGYADVRARYRIARQLRVSARYAYVEDHAAQTAGEPDRSYREQGFEPGVRLRLLPALDLSLSYRLGLRAYTTTAMPLVDPSYRDRRSTRHTARSAIVWKVSKTFETHAAVVYRVSDTERPHDVSASDDETSWRQTEIRAGVTHTF